MENNPVYIGFKKILEEQLELLPDKPEETIDSTLAALWLFAGGEKVSAEKAVIRDLPDLTDNQVAELRKLVDVRISGVPLAHITGRQQFLDVELISNSKALIPRKETEILGRTALRFLEEMVAEGSEEILAFDLCCGAGNLAVALASHIGQVRFLASDLSTDSVELTRENIRFHHLEKRIEVLAGSVFEAFEGNSYEGRVDMVICNPPYISDTKVAKMAKEISDHEPDLAFKGGMLGLSVITELIRKAPVFLKEEGWLVFEVGLGQGEFVEKLCLKTSLYREVGTVKDDQGNIRVITARK